MYSEGYPNFHVTFVKDKRIAEVTPVRLKDMGFPCDVEKEAKFGDLDKETSNNLIEEFIFLIEETLPRSIQDLFYKIGLDPCDVYWKAYEQAVKKMQLEVVEDHCDRRYGQFVDYVESQVVARIDGGMLLHDIYETTCTTKTLIMNVADTYYQYIEMTDANPERWILMPVEMAAFKRNYKYKLQESIPDDNEIYNVVIYDKNNAVLAVKYVGIDYYIEGDEDALVFESNHVPVLTVDYDEVFDVEDGPYISTTINNVIKGGVEAAKSHNINRMRHLKEREEDDNFWDDF